MHNVFADVNVLHISAGWSQVSRTDNILKRVCCLV